MTPESAKEWAALAKAQITKDHHAESKLLYQLFKKREKPGCGHAKKPLAARLLEGCVFGATDCWHWCRPRNNGGYGLIVFHNRIEVVHRLAYRAFIGQIPEGLSVLHTCDNRACINPEHLWLGTYSDNLQDCWNKGRRVYKRRTH